jgi:hypothetical protein
MPISHPTCMLIGIWDRSKYKKEKKKNELLEHTWIEVQKWSN